MGRQILDPNYDLWPKRKYRQACRLAESTPGDPGKLAMMDRVRPSRSTSGGVEVARRGVAGRLQLTFSVRPDVRVRSLEPIFVLSYLRRPTAMETSKGNASKSN